MKFLDYLKENKIVLFDGAMGTELAKRGLEMSGVSNIRHPDHVLQIHKEYVKAGADVLITNTLTLNRINLESHGIKTDIREVNLAGAALARQAAHAGQFVFGDIGSAGKLLEPFGEYTEEQFYENFHEQAAILAEGKVDGYIVETIFDLREAVCALKACKDAANLPVIVSFSFSLAANHYRTMMGNTIAGIADTMAENKADAIGANCGDLDAEDMAKITMLFKEATNLPIIIQPNAGKPEVINNRAHFGLQPEEFAEGLIKCLGHGASMIGGCCGTSPAHIKALAKRIK